MRRVSFQGERGAYSEGAAAGLFGAGIETVPCATFAGALAAVEGGGADCAVIPVENSIEGGVGESNDLLAETGLHAVGEAYHPVEHCLLGSGRLEGVRTVYSHPQALGQCRRFIRERGLRTVPTYDTAGSARMVAGMRDASAACIAGRTASEVHGLPVIAEGIADEPGNRTRFLVMARDAGPAAGADKTSLVFSLRHEPGALQGILARFGGVNLTRIESRPRRGSPWEYNFFVDLEGGAGDPAVAAALEAAGADALHLRVLGSYPSAGPG